MAKEVINMAERPMSGDAVKYRVLKPTHPDPEFDQLGSFGQPPMAERTQMVRIAAMETVGYLHKKNRNLAGELVGMFM